MDLVELGPLSNALVGLPGVSGLSVEQRKRLTIAVELVANPAIVFMVWQTSGLSFFSLVDVLKVFSCSTLAVAHHSYAQAVLNRRTHDNCRSIWPLGRVTNRARLQPSFEWPY